MKRFFENTLISGAYNKALRVVALLCVLLGVSTSAMGETYYLWYGSNDDYNNSNNYKWSEGVSFSNNKGTFTINTSYWNCYVYIAKGSKSTSNLLKTPKFANPTTSTGVSNLYQGNRDGYNRIQFTTGTDASKSFTIECDFSNSSEYTFKVNTGSSSGGDSGGGNSGSGDSGNTGNCNSIEIYCHYEASVNHDMNLHMWNNGGDDYTTWPGPEAQKHVEIDGVWYAKWVYESTNQDICLKFTNGETADDKKYESANKCGLKSGNKYYFYLPNGWGGQEPTLKKTEAIECGGSGDDDIDPTGCTTVYLNTTTITWDHDGAELYVYYFNNTKNTNAWKKLTAASSCTKIFYASIPNDSDGFIFVRLNNQTGTPSWDRKWSQTEDLHLDPSKPEFKLSTVGNENDKAQGSLQLKTCNEEADDCGGDSGETTAECDYIEVWCKDVTVNCYAWDVNKHELLGAWPGQKTGARGTYNGAEYAVWSFANIDNINVIFNNGSGQQTEDITGLRKGYRYIFNLDNWSVISDNEKINCTLPATDVLLAREAKVDVVEKTGVVYGYLKNNTDCKKITDYGFYFCTTADGAAACTPVENNDLKWAATSTTQLARGEEFSANTGTLFDGTTYYYRAYAVIGGETVLSQEVRSITTEPCKAQKAWGDPVVYTVDATFTADNTCKLYFRDVQKAIDHLKGSYVNDEEYQYVTKDNTGSFNLNQPVVINVRYYDDTPNDPKTAYTYRGTTNVGMTAGDVSPTNVNLIQDFNKTATNRANTLTIKAGTTKAKPWIHHIVIRNSKNITLDSLCIYSDPTGLKDNALEIDVNSTEWPSITPSFTDANITVQNCMIGSAGFVGFQVSGYDGITFKGNDIEASFEDNTNRLNILNWGASGKFIACKNIKFIQNNFRGSQPTLLWIQDSENALFMNNVFWNTNTFLKQNNSEVTPCAIKLVNQYGRDIDNIGFFYNTFYFADNKTTGVSSPYNFFTEYMAASHGSTTGTKYFKENIYFQYNNCYSYDMDCVGSDAFLGTGSGGGGDVVYSVDNNNKTTSNPNFCPNNFWGVLDGEGRSTFDFTTGCAVTKINVKDQVCETTASGPASLIIRGDDMNLGSAPDVSFTGIKLNAEESLADRYLVGVRPNGDSWTYGAYQTREAKDVEKIYWVGLSNNWDDRNNWEFEVKNNDKMVRQRVSCVENLSENLHVVIEEIGSIEVPGGRKWPKLPESFDPDDRKEKSGIPVVEQVNAGSTNKFADYIELEYGAGIIGVENLVNGELHYTKASTKFVSPRSEWILVGPTIKPWDEETPATDDVRDVLSGDYFIANHEPHVYMHKAMFLQDGNVGWDLTFADLKAPLTHNEVFAMQIPDEYGFFKLPAELHYAYIAPDESKIKDATVAKEFSFEGRFYNESSLPTYTGLKEGESVLISNTYPANIDAYMLDESGLGKVQIYDYDDAKSFMPLKARTSTPILSQHGFVFTPAKDGDLVITEDYFLNTLTKRAANIVEPYFRINVKNMASRTSSEVEVEYDELKEDAINYGTDAKKVFNSMEASLPDMYIMRYDMKWAEVVVPTMTEAIPLGVRISQAGTTIRFTLVESDGLGDIILEDRLEGKTYNLTAGQLCEFSDLPVGDCEGRFYINLAEKEEEDNEEEGGDVSTEVDEETFTDSGISIIGNSEGVVVSCSTDMELQCIYINDMSGKTAMYKVSGNYVAIDLPVAQGVYTINVIADKASKTGKVILK